MFDRLFYGFVLFFKKYHMQFHWKAENLICNFHKTCCKVWERRLKGVGVRRIVVTIDVQGIYPVTDKDYLMP